MVLVLVLDQLNRLAIELVAVTNVAIAEGGAGDLSLSQWRLLAVLGGAPAPLRLNEIAARVSSSMPSASRLVQRMERCGFVASSRDPSDGRGRRVALTAAGEALRGRVVARRSAILTESLGELVLRPGLADALADVADRLTRWV